MDDQLVMTIKTGEEFKCHFAGGFDKEGFPLVWIGGATSWSVVDHPIKYFKPSCGWNSWYKVNKEPMCVYAVYRYSYDESYEDSYFLTKKEAYKRIIQITYEFYQENYNERLLYGKRAEFYSKLDSMYIKTIKITS